MRLLGAILSITFFIGLSSAKEIGFTQEDRERLIRLEATLKVFMEQTNTRFEDMNKRFEELREDMNKRFEQTDKRFEDMNKRFEELREDMNKRFEQVDKRFEQVDKRFEQMIQFLWMITGIFTTLTAVVIGFAYWDRRTIIRKAKEETIEHLEERGSIRKLIEILKEKAKTDPELAKILKQFNIF